MFSRKKSEAPAQTKARNDRIRWEWESAPTQRFYIDVKNTEWSVSLKTGGETKPPDSFSWHGIAHNDLFDGLLCLGHTYTYTPGNVVRDFLATQWTKMPSVLDGYVKLETDDEIARRLNRQWLRVVLYCAPADLRGLMDAFYTGVASANGRVQVFTQVAHPDYRDEDNYWRARWRSHALQVLNWSVFIGATAPGFERV